MVSLCLCAAGHRDADAKNSAEMRSAMENQTKGAAAMVGGFFRALGSFFSGFGTAVAKGDIFVKLSLLWWGGRLCPP